MLFRTESSLVPDPRTRMRVWRARLIPSHCRYWINKQTVSEQYIIEKTKSSIIKLFLQVCLRHPVVVRRLIIHELNVISCSFCKTNVFERHKVRCIKYGSPINRLTWKMGIFNSYSHSSSLYHIKLLFVMHVARCILLLVISLTDLNVQRLDNIISTCYTTI